VPRQRRFVVALASLTATLLLLAGCATPSSNERASAASEPVTEYRTLDGTPLSKDEYEHYALTGEWPGGRYVGGLPLHVVTRSHVITAAGDRDLVLRHYEQLIAAGADANARDEAGRTPLHWLLQSPERFMPVAEAAQLLIDAGADVNAATDGGWLPLHFAARYQTDRYNAQEAITVLLEAGADVNATTAEGNTPLIIAAGSRQLIRAHPNRGVAALIEAGADVNYAGAERTALVAALHAGNAGIVRQLLAAGADPRRSGTGGETAYDVVTAILVRAEEAAASGQPITVGLRNRVRAAEAVFGATGR